MLDVEEAQRRILSRATRLSSEQVPLQEACGRILAEDVRADIPMPAFDNSAMDGYAVHAADTSGALLENPVRLPIDGEIRAGDLPGKPLPPGMVRRIMTGAPMPPGADAVIMVEDTLVEDGFAHLYASVHSGQHLRVQGEDFLAGTQLLPSGQLIRPAGLALLATAGCDQVPVYRRPRVALFTTGDELVNVVSGELPPPGCIRDSNLPMLKALLEEAGAEIVLATRLPDSPEHTLEALREAADPFRGLDMILTVGGVSVGDYDFVKPAVEKLGALDLWRVAIKPGKPIAFGNIGNCLFFGLPGNPASAFVTFELFVRPALLQMSGLTPPAIYRLAVQALLTTPLEHTPGRREFVRGIVSFSETGLLARPAGDQGSHMLISMANANALLVIPESAEGLSAGERITALLLDRL